MLQKLACLRKFRLGVLKVEKCIVSRLASSVSAPESEEFKVSASEQKKGLFRTGLFRGFPLGRGCDEALLSEKTGFQ